MYNRYLCQLPFVDMIFTQVLLKVMASAVSVLLATQVAHNAVVVLLYVMKIKVLFYNNLAKTGIHYPIQPKSLKINGPPFPAADKIAQRV